jgi:phage FluMu gp28-like protein
VIIDEAAFHDKLGELLKAALALLMWGGQVHVMSTHNGDDNPFNELVGDIRAGKKPYSLHRTTLDDALAAGLYQRIALRLGKPYSPDAEAAFRQELLDYYGEAADEELHCIPARSAGQYLPRALIESCMDETIPVLRKSFPPDFAQRSDVSRRAEVEDWLQLNAAPILAMLPKNAVGFVGGDFGRTGDLTVFVPLIEDAGLRRRAACVVELRNGPFKQQEQILFHLCDRLPRFLGAALDARGIGMPLAESAMQRYSIHRVAQVMLTQAWSLENFPRYKAAFEDRNITLPRDADIMDDHRAVRMEKGVPKIPETARLRGRDGGQRHGDAAIAGCLAWAAAYLLDHGPAEYQSVGRRKSAGLDRPDNPGRHDGDGDSGRRDRLGAY